MQIMKNYGKRLLESLPFQCICDMPASTASLTTECAQHHVPAHELQFHRDQGQSYHGVRHCSDCLSAKDID